MIGAIELRRMAGLYNGQGSRQNLGMNRWMFYGQLRGGAMATSQNLESCEGVVITPQAK